MSQTPENRETLEYLRKATAALQETKQRLKQVEDRRHEPIAVISMACRFPGGVESPEALWQLVEEGRDAVGPVPRSRWNVDEVFDSDPSAPGKTYTRWGGFVGDVDRFDPTFFGINPAEARTSDPQQRLLLETAWEALERAGLTQAELAGSATGVFVGICGTEYLTEVVHDGAMDMYAFLGTAHSAVVGRLSYWLGLQGPNVSLDTACSSSLVAIHQACQALRNGECDMALSGGVNLLLSPWAYIYFSKVRALSPTGRCRTFSADADGYVRAEGCGIMVLKRLSDAQRDGDEILALVRGSAVNQDGRSNGFTAPSGPAQQEVIRRALATARVEPATVDAVECHGTGTRLGDPIEVQSLDAVYGQDRPADRPVVLGSVKTNIGHAEGAAGIAGAMKAVLSLKNKRLPKILHFTQPNPHIAWDELKVRVPTDLEEWKRGAHPRRIGVSSFGISGTNAHLVLEEAPEPPARPTVARAESYLLVLSAKSEAALRASAQRVSTWMSAPPGAVALHDVAYTAAVRRTHHDYRLAATAERLEEITEQLAAFAKGEAASGTVVQGVIPATGAPRLVMVFSGQGSQWAGMGARLLAEPAFRAKVEACDALLKPITGWSVIEELTAGADRSRLGETEIVQPALFALQIGLAALLESWGVKPHAVIGHSIGEVAAAHVSGALSLKEAVRLVALRGGIMQRATGLGKMAWVALPAADVAPMLEGRESTLGIGAINDPSSCVISGDSAGVDEIVAGLTERAIQCRPLRVNYAFHSPQMTALAAELRERLGRIDAQAGGVTMYSAVTGAVIGGRALDAEYWRRNVRDPVNFAGAVASACRDGAGVFLEVGPHPVLTANIQQSVAEAKSSAQTVFTLRRDSDDRRSILSSLGGLHVRGCAVDFRGLFPQGGALVPLPPYPFQRERFWFTASNRAVANRDISHSGDGHPLLGRALRPARQPLVCYWEGAFDLASAPFLSDHRVRGSIIFPGAGYLEMALAAGLSFYETDEIYLEECQFERMLEVPAEGSREVQAALLDEEGRRAFFEVLSRDESTKEWVRFASMTVRRASRHGDATLTPPGAIIQRCPHVVDPAEHYAGTQARGFEYGPAFQGLERIWLGEGEAIGQVRLPENAGEAASYRAHPAILDACLQIAAEMFRSAGVEGTLVPAEIGQVRYHQTLPSEVWAHVGYRRADSADSHVIDVVLSDEEGQPLLELESVRLRRLPANTVKDPFAGCAYSSAWRPKAWPEASDSAEGTWVLFADQSGVGAALAAELRARGGHVVEVSAGFGYSIIDAERFTVDPREIADYQRLLAEVLPEGEACRGVLHLWGLDVTPWESVTLDALIADTRLAAFSAVRALQAVVGHGFRDPPRMTILTRGAAVVPGDVPVAGGTAAALWGLGRIIAVERPELHCVRVDLDPASNEAPVREILGELLGSDGEDQVAFRQDRRLVDRLERQDIEPSEPVQLKPEATYLITGGLGGLGLHAAQWMVQRGARHLALVGRGAPSNAAQAVIAGMIEAGARVTVVSADVSVKADVESVLAQIGATMPELRGIIHAAGVLHDRTLLDLDEAAFFAPLSAKMLGAWNLHAATLDATLDFFVMYSSAASVFGSAGQGNYAAANAFLDALSHLRVSLGLPSMSLQWGPFSEVGMAAATGNRGQRLSLRGVESFTPADGTELLSRLLHAPRAEVALARVSMRQLFDFYPRLVLSPLFELLRVEPLETAQAPAERRRFRDELMAMRPTERRAGLQRRVVEILARVLGIAPERLDPTAPLQSFGLDSLMSLEGKDRLEAGLGLRLSAALLYTYPTVTALVEHLLTELRLGPAELGETHEEAPRGPEIWDELSADTAAAMLDEKLLDLEDYLK